MTVKFARIGLEKLKIGVSYGTKMVRSLVEFIMDKEFILAIVYRDF